MIDVTFRIVATYVKGNNWPWNVHFSPDVGDLKMTDSEWTAFKSLLHPSIEADFSITELNEKGEKL